MIATTLTLGASVLGVCNEVDWYEGPTFEDLQESVSNITGRQLARARGPAGGGGGTTAGGGGASSTGVDSTGGLLLDTNASASTDWMLQFQSVDGYFDFMAWPFSQCRDGRVPLAAQELLALVVLLHWLKLGRIASQSNTFGPLFQSVLVMMVDVVKWLFLISWPVLAFTSCFNVLFREPCNAAPHETHATHATHVTHVTHVTPRAM